MTISVSEMESLLDTLTRARMSGVRSTQHGTQKIEFKSDAEMDKAINALENKIANATSRSKFGVAGFDRGDN